MKNFKYDFTYEDFMEELFFVCVCVSPKPILFKGEQEEKKLQQNLKTHQSGGNNGIYSVHCHTQITQPEHKT